MFAGILYGAILLNIYVCNFSLSIPVNGTVSFVSSMQTHFGFNSVGTDKLVQLLGNARMNLETDQNTPDENWMECRHPIYCNTTYLIAFQLSNIFNDSKTFVDSPTKLPINQSIILLNQLLKIDSISFGSDKDAVVNYFKNSDIDFKKVYDEVFYYPGVDVIPTSMPTELAARPMAGIQSHYFQWAKFLDSTWAMLSRKVNTTLISKGSGTSMSETLYPFIVPGGRFREFYYWDSYWVVKGLLVGQRFNMVENILKNFYDYVERHGYVPNGNRVYYSNRSQPPLLVQMVKDYFLASGDIKVLSYAIRKLEKEYLFWMTKRVANGLVEGDYPLNVYNVSNSAPRPESFVEDLAIASSLPDPADSVRFYKDVASGAETGWDFSSRFIRGSGFDLGHIYTSRVLPVDLNSIMYLNEMTISWMLSCLYESLEKRKCPSWEKFSNLEVPSFINKTLDWVPADDPNSPVNTETLPYPLRASYYFVSAQRRKKSIRKYFWNTEKKLFMDYDLQLKSFVLSSDNKIPAADLYLSALFPLWAKAFDFSVDGPTFKDISTMVKNFNQSLFSPYPGGVPTSLIDSEQQWDFPNAWAPLQWIAVEAMINLPSGIEGDQSHYLAKKFAPLILRKFMKSAYCGWNASRPTKAPSGKEYVDLLKRFYSEPQKFSTTSFKGSGMFEKYDVRYIGRPGNGGEYIVQDGFGWTNGVILDWIKRFGSNTTNSKFAYKLPPIGNCSEVVTTEDGIDEGQFEENNSRRGVSILFSIAAFFIVALFLVCLYRVMNNASPFRVQVLNLWSTLVVAANNFHKRIVEGLYTLRNRHARYSNLPTRGESMENMAESYFQRRNGEVTRSRTPQDLQLDIL